MTSDEWLGIVAWVNERARRKWTPDQATRFGFALRDYEAEKVRGALARLVRRGRVLDLRSIKTELRHTSKFTTILEKRHIELYPDGCNSRWCDVCLDIQQVRL